MPTIKLFTIGFTKKTAEEFFLKLQQAGVRRIIDIRLNNTSQLAGFAKKDDLRYFLRSLGNIDYIYMPELAPTQEILDSYKKNKGAWSAYECQFRVLMAERKVEQAVTPQEIDHGCFLCSEDKPQHCHRRLVAEYFKSQWGDVEVEHIL